MTDTQLSKTYKPEEHEPGVWQRWFDADAFHADPALVLSGEKPPYCILIPPPNVTAALHLGHALNNTLQDVLVRAHRMKGYETLWLPGTDHAGIATQTVVDKRLKAEGKPALAEHKQMEARGENGREKFIATVQAWKDEYERRITDQLKAMGCSCDWDRQRFTMDDICARAVREAFFRLFSDGLIERGKRLVNWDPVTQTALADDEVENRDVEGAFYYLRYPLVHKADPGDHRPVTWGELAAKGYPGADEHPDDDEAWITVATTRPETYLGDTAVAVNPKDPRAEALRGLHAELPLVGRVVPILEDDYVVLPVSLGGDENDPKAQMATGFLKVTPAHDPNDWELGLRHQQTIERECSAGTHLINVMAPDASISADHGWVDFEPHGAARVFVGLSREDAARKVVEEFQAHTINNQPLLEDIKPHVHSVGHSYRSHAPVEPYLSDQWYCRVTDDRLRGNAQRALVIEQRTAESLEAWPGSTPNEPRPSGSVPRTTYLITFTTYGTWLHGDDRGSADRDHNLPGTPYLDPDTARESDEERQLKHPAIELNQNERERTASAIEEVCDFRGWTLHACNVRTNHVHVVVTADQPPERVMDDFKSYATRALRTDPKAAHDAPNRERTWTRHGSTRYLNDEVSANAAIRYVLYEQGDDLGGVIDGRGAEKKKPLPHGRGSSDGSMAFHPARYAHTYETWHDNLRDWCISRQLWWGHRIPVWCNPDPGAECPVAGDGVSVQKTETGVTVCLRSDDPDRIEQLENAGFERDPDVLDTWFSSALWPLSTLGWPEPDERTEGLLDAFNPTSVLCTAREIITLWVSRMVMFNRYFLASGPRATACEGEEDRRDACPTQAAPGPVPFRDVFIHAMIQDGDGRKMSKSLGNGVDPLDIIHSHGADAMRFTLVEMTTQTQDVRMPVVQDPATGRNTSPKFDLGRNFCNKLWNAARFALSKLPPVPGGTGVPPVSTLTPADLLLADRWMLARLHAGIAEIDETLATYQFSAYAKALYDLVRRDFCDWYLEAVKSTIADNPAQQGVLRLVLDSLLRLLHPVVPFITETIYERLSEIPAPVLDGLTLRPPTRDNTLATAGWPAVDESLVDAQAEQQFERVRTIVDAIRQVRSQHKVEPRRKIALHADAALAGEIEAAGGLIESLAGLHSITTDAPEGPAATFTLDGVEHRLGDLADAVDASAERERLEKERADLEKSIKALAGRLANPGYTDKAPPHLVQQTRDQHEQALADLAAVVKALESLG